MCALTRTIAADLRNVKALRGSLIVFTTEDSTKESVHLQCFSTDDSSKKSIGSQCLNLVVPMAP